MTEILNQCFKRCCAPSFSSGVPQGFIGEYADSEVEMHVVPTLATIRSGGCVQMALNPERIGRNKPTFLITFVYSWVFLLHQITFPVLFSSKNNVINIIALKVCVQEMPTGISISLERNRAHRNSLVTLSLFAYWCYAFVCNIWISNHNYTKLDNILVCVLPKSTSKSYLET